MATFVAGSAQLFDAEGRTFQIAGPGTLVDATGRRWNAASGESETGQQMTRLAAIPSFWFAWYDFHPDTLVWGAFGVQSMSPKPDSRGNSGTDTITLRFTGPVATEFRNGTISHVRVEPAQPVEFQWVAPDQLDIKPTSPWPTGTVTVLVAAQVADENGTAMGSDYSASFTVGTPYNTAALSPLLVLVGLLFLAVFVRRGR